MYLDLFTLSYLALFVPLIGWAGVLFVRWRNVPKLAGEVYDSNVDKALLNPAIPREAYIAAYRRAESPRLAIYRCALAFIALLSLPVLVATLSGFMQDLNIQSEDFGLSLGPVRISGILGDMAVFVIIMGLYVALLAAMTYAYYRGKPMSLKAEVRRLEEEHG
ncbi:MAG: hypothetical protein AAGF20_03925 [Pseudomonadota bacterium]